MLELEVGVLELGNELFWFYFECSEGYGGVKVGNDRFIFVVEKV